MNVPYNIRQTPPPAPEMAQEEETVEVMDDLDEQIDHSKDVVTIDLPDGSVSINFGPLKKNHEGDASDHDENLALHLDEAILSSVADDLLRLIDDDIRRQEQRLEDIQSGIDLLGIKLEKPRAEPGEEGMSVVRHPLLLEAILRFQANARGEMLPADGPVKVRNDGGDTQARDKMANALEQDFNHYLTNGAPEYYPDTDRMFFSLGHGGEAYKKVYWHPIKRRPVSETIDRKDLILSDGAVSIEACGRVTHRSRMKPSDVRRMQLAGVWRDCMLGIGGLFGIADNPVDEKLANISGVAEKTSIEPEQLDREILECYCELNLEGFEHKEDGEETGLALPYRVTLDKDAREVLEIRRWWEEGDETYTRREVFVEYVFVPAFPGVNLGLLHILGNASRALTAAWRIALDNGMLANFPGGLMARSTGRQQTTNIRVAPGQTAPVDTDGQPLRDAFMPLPYRDVTPGFVNIVQAIEATSQRVGGTAETATGEGRSDAPVGTTIALIEQATKVLNAVHKRMHSAQAKEFRLLKELFRIEPEALWRGNRSPSLPQDKEMVVAALNDSDIVPVADPNTASQTLRIQKAIAIKTLAAGNPQIYDMAAVDRRVLEMVGVEDADELFAKGPVNGPGPDPSKVADAQAKMLTAQAKIAETKAKIEGGAFQGKSTSPQEMQLREMAERTKMMDSVSDNENRAKDREAKLAMERMKLQRQEMIHDQRLNHDREKMAFDQSREDRKLAIDRERDFLQADREREARADQMSLEREKLNNGGSAN